MYDKLDEIVLSKKGFAENRHFHVSANFMYLEAIKCHFEARNGKFGHILSRIHSYLIFSPLPFMWRFHRTLLYYSEQDMMWSMEMWNIPLGKTIDS